MTIPKGIKQIRRAYGNIVITGNRITGPKYWPEENITLLVSPTFRECKSTKIWCHKLVAPDLKAILTEIDALEYELDKPLIYSIDGCWVVRQKRTGAKISTHAWGIAIDINAARNPMGGMSNQSQAMVRCFTDRGWKWGGDFGDPMHFQACSGY